MKEIKLVPIKNDITFHDLINKKLIKNYEIIHGMIWSKRILLKVINIPLDKYANVPFNEFKGKGRFYKLLTIPDKNEWKDIF